jgi:hypothetical protein
MMLVLHQMKSYWQRAVFNCAVFDEMRCLQLNFNRPAHPAVRPLALVGAAAAPPGMPWLLP